MSGSQFFISVADSGGLDRTYTVFGEVVRGMEKMGSLVVLLLAEQRMGRGPLISCTRATREQGDCPSYPAPFFSSLPRRRPCWHTSPSNCIDR